jgi:hypothetical protein
MKSKARIVKRTYPAGEVEYVIQQRYFWFFWEDAGPFLGLRRYRFTSLEEAQKNLWQYDGTPEHKDVVVWP